MVQLAIKGHPTRGGEVIQLLEMLGGSYYYQCIPYKGNEYLLGTTDDCDEYFKIW